MTGAPCGRDGHRKNWTKEHRHQPTSSEQTLAQRREHPYIWASWLPRLLTGENSCEWAIWFKAHYQDWARSPSKFNQAQWMLNHTALLNKRKANWKHGGFDVNIEGQNSSELHGRSATLVGKPDLITQRDGQAVIVDVKTGQDSPRHVVQVMIYLYAIPRALERYRTLKLRVSCNAPTACTDMNVTAGIRYVYRVKAINTAGVGPQSNYVRIEP